MDPEPNRESTMEERALANDLQIADMDGTSTSRGNDEEGQTAQSLKEDSDHNSTLVQNGDCRICFGPAEASGEDPILELGCQCKDELRFGHLSCLTRWFVPRLRRRGTTDCDICRNSIGAHLEAIVRNIFQEASHARPVQLLLQLPREELDRLQVPLETPDFNDLPEETRQALVASMDRQEELHLRGETRESATFIMAYILAFISADQNTNEPLLVNEIQASIREAAEIRDEILGGSVELVDLFPNDGGLDIDDEDMEDYAYRDRDIVQLDRENLLPSRDELENVLNEISTYIDDLAENGDGDMLLYEFLRFRDDSVPPRDSTYGRHRVFLLRDIP